MQAPGDPEVVGSLGHRHAGAKPYTRGPEARRDRLCL